MFDRKCYLANSVFNSNKFQISRSSFKLDGAGNKASFPVVKWISTTSKLSTPIQALSSIFNLGTVFDKCFPCTLLLIIDKWKLSNQKRTAAFQEKEIWFVLQNKSFFISRCTCPLFHYNLIFYILTFHVWTEIIVVEVVTLNGFQSILIKNLEKFVENIYFQQHIIDFLDDFTWFSMIYT